MPLAHKIGLLYLTMVMSAQLNSASMSGKGKGKKAVPVVQEESGPAAASSGEVSARQSVQRSSSCYTYNSQSFQAS
jgi:hypothetical protein